MTIKSRSSRIHLTWLALAAGVALVTASSAARAEPSPLATEIANLVPTLQTEQAKEPKLRDEADAHLQKNEPLVREKKIYETQIETRIVPIANAIKADGQVLERDVSRHNEGVSRHNANCAGELPRPAFERCQGEKQQWDARQRSLEGRQEALRSRVGDVGRQLRQYTERMEGIDAQVKRNIAASNAAREALKAVHERVERMKARLVTACTDAKHNKDAEAIHQCHSVNWDGTRADLPPLESVRP